MQQQHQHHPGHICVYIYTLENTLETLDLIMLDHNYLTGDMKDYCNATEANRDKVFITADCASTPPNSSAQVSCDCCNLCCSYNDLTCNDDDRLAQYNPEWQDGYQRTGFQAYDFSPPNN